jgi:hypothetical protein
MKYTYEAETTKNSSEYGAQGESQDKKAIGYWFLRGG